MGSIGPFQIIIIAVVILILFGRGRISEMMGDFGKGVKSFRKGLAEDEEPKKPAAQIAHENTSASGPAVEPVDSATSEKTSG